jgi:hypothetical protein
MTIHIDELVVRTQVEEGGGRERPGGGGGEASGTGREELIEECVERVMEILREREEP